MPINTVSFLGQTNAQTTRLQQLNTEMNTLTQQLTTQKKTDTFSGLGLDAGDVQRYNMQIGHAQTYLGNITTAQTNINLMSTNLSRASAVIQDTIAAIQAQQIGSVTDMQTIRSVATQALSQINDIVNSNVGGRYFFAGSAADQEPLTNAAAAPTEMQTQTTNWLNGSQTTAQFIANTSGASATSLGFDPSLSAAGAVTVQISPSTSLDYTSIATQNGLSDAARSLAIASQMQKPDPSTDVPTTSDFSDAMQSILSQLVTAQTEIDSTNKALAGKSNILTTAQNDSQQDINTYKTLLSNKEDIDPTEVSVKINALQTQLQASYQVTSMVSKLSLVNFLS